MSGNNSGANWKVRKKTDIQFEDSSISTLGQMFTVRDTEDYLAREIAFQNPIDEKLYSERPVKTRIRMGKVPEHKKKYARSLMEGILPHLEANGLPSEFSDLITSDGDIPYLVFEDYQTRGLVGDISSNEPDEKGTKKENRNNIYNYFRSMGSDNKSGEDAGSGGVGKSRGNAASKLGLSFAHSIRSSDWEAVLMGRTNLSWHDLDNTRYQPYAFYCANPDDDDDLEMPVTDEASLKEFKETFGIKRGKDQSGLDVVIPFPVDNIDIPILVTSVIKTGYLPIIMGELEIEIIDDTNAPVELDINLPDVFEDILQQYPPVKNFSKDADQFKKLMSLVQNSPAFMGSSKVHTKLQGSGKAPTWGTDEDKIMEEADLNKCREIFQAGEILNIQVPLYVQKKGSQPTPTFFTVTLQKDITLNGKNIVLSRNWLHIPHVPEGNRNGIRAFTYATDPPLTEMLRISEGGAHWKWDQLSHQISISYDYGYNTILFVNNAVRELVKLLSPVSSNTASEEYKPYFNISIPSGSTGSGGQGSTKNGTGSGKGKKRKYSKSYKWDGKQKGNSTTYKPVVGSKIKKKDKFSLKTSYIQVDTESSKTIGPHSKSDFDFNDPSCVKTHDVAITVVSPNEMNIVVDGTDPSITISGLDRDLIAEFMDIK